MLKLKSKEVFEPGVEAQFTFHKKLKYWTIMHCHEFYEFFVITSGTVDHIVNGVRMKLSEGALVFIRPHDVHSYEKYGDDEVELLNINFRASTVNSVFKYLGDGFRAERLVQTELPPLKILLLDETNAIIRKYEEILIIPAGLTAEICSAGKALLAELLIRHFSPQFTVTIHPDTPVWLNELQGLMQKRENFINGLSMLYQLSPVSPEHLCRTVKKHFHQTPTEWINEMRLMYSAHLLKYRDEEILTVSLESGFNSLSHFYSLFYKRFQMSPAKYRKVNRKVVIPE